MAGRIEASFRASAASPAFALEPKFDHSVRSWCRAEAIVMLLAEALDAVGIDQAMAELTEGDEDESRPAAGGVKRKLRGRKTAPLLDALHRWEGRASALRKELGLSPMAYAALARDVVLVGKVQEDALARLASQGAEIRQRRDAQLRLVSGEATAERLP